MAKAADAAQHQPESHAAVGPFLGPGALDGPARLLEDGLHAVHPAAELDQLLARHRGEFGLGGFLESPVVAHARAPIHIATPITATMPMIHIAIASEVGPKPPSP